MTHRGGGWDKRGREQVSVHDMFSSGCGLGQAGCVAKHKDR